MVFLPLAISLNCVWWWSGCGGQHKKENPQKKQNASGKTYHLLDLCVVGVIALLVAVAQGKVHVLLVVALVAVGSLAELVLVVSFGELVLVDVLVDDLNQVVKLGKSGEEEGGEEEEKGEKRSVRLRP